jgi:hypothetical protein
MRSANLNSVEEVAADVRQLLAEFARHRTLRPLDQPNY